MKIGTKEINCLLYAEDIVILAKDHHDMKRLLRIAEHLKEDIDLVQIKIHNH